MCQCVCALVRACVCERESESQRDNEQALLGIGIMNFFRRHDVRDLTPWSGVTPLPSDILELPFLDWLCETRLIRQ